MMTCAEFEARMAAAPTAVDKALVAVEFTGNLNQHYAQALADEVLRLRQLTVHALRHATFIANEERAANRMDAFYAVNRVWHALDNMFNRTPDGRRI